MTQAVILAGGKGTRLAARLDGLPKPLVDVAGVPLLERQLRYLASYGVDDVVVLVNYRAEIIEDFVVKLDDLGLRIRLVDDGEPRGTAGAVLSVLDQLEERFLVLYGDTFVNVDLDSFLDAHRRSGAGATLFLHPNDHPQDSDIVEIDGDGWVRRFHPYPHPAGAVIPNMVNAALYVIEKSALEPYRSYPVPADFGKNLFASMLGDGAKIFGYPTYEYIKDLGTPKRLDKVERDLEGGIVERASLKVRQKAVFLDRDGTLNIHRGFINDPSQIELLPGVTAGIRRLHDAEYRLVIATNQPVIARGEASVMQLQRIHYRLEMLLGQEGAYVDAIYFCPHHPDSGFAGEVPELKIACDCRKPEPGLVKRAANALNIDLSRSWMVGDSMRDIAMAERAGLRSVLVTTGEHGDGCFAGKPNTVCNSFTAAVDAILNFSEPNA